jgi:hypothetical protein
MIERKDRQWDKFFIAGVDQTNLASTSIINHGI